MRMTFSLVLVVALLTACSSNYSSSGEGKPIKLGLADSAMIGKANSSRLADVLAAQPEDVAKRFSSRNPQETLEFFGIAPGMTVMEALPGGGWYSKILLSYLSADGKLIGADYAPDMYPLFGFFSPEQIEAKKTWVTDWTAQAKEWGVSDSATISAFQFGAMPERMASSADAVVFIRALHNLQRFEKDGAYMTKALADAHRLLNPGGIVGIVQHRAPADAAAAFSEGARGYLKQDQVIDLVTSAGFTFVGSSEINANPKDQPSGDDIVWRLPPSMVTSREDPALRAKMQAVGESDRMTLKFRKK